MQTECRVLLYYSNWKKSSQKSSWGTGTRYPPLGWFSCIIRVWNLKTNLQSFWIPDSTNSSSNYSQEQQGWICPQLANLNSTPFGIPWLNASTKSLRISHERYPERSTPRNPLGRSGQWSNWHRTHFHDVRIWYRIWSQTKISRPFSIRSFLLRIGSGWNSVGKLSH